MRQVTHRRRDGRVEVIEVPLPELGADGVLVDVRASLLSAGTERSALGAERQGLAAQARARPDQMRQLVDHLRRDGVRETVQAVRGKLDEPKSLGYSASGVVLAVGDRVAGIAPGVRVACGGASAAHADVDYVPANLCVPLPPDVGFHEGCYATVGSIALHGVRQADVRLGETVAVIGLGLVGQLTCELLQVAGCTVVGVDIAQSLVRRTVERDVVQHGYVRDELEDALPPAASDCDAVIITAASSSTDPVDLASRLARDRARIIIVGDVRMEFPRPSYYGKELDIRLSRSYGPGRYDRAYEERGLDYPIGYVRWTERRNMAAFVGFIGQRKVDVDALTSERVPLERVPEAYDRLVSSADSPLGIVIEYGSTRLDATVVSTVPQAPKRRPEGHLGRGASVIGAGAFAQNVLIPALREAGYPLNVVASARGLSASSAAARFGFQRAGSAEEAIAAPDSALVVVSTRHDTHADLAESALKQGVDVFVEKPPCVTAEELTRLEQVERETDRRLFVGFNRRHAPLAVKLRDHLAGRDLPLSVVYRVNVPELPLDHWLNDPESGGGRLVGEGCHFFDFACWLVGDIPISVSCQAHPSLGRPLASAQSFTSAMMFANGSMATILYCTGGSPRLPKEYIEAHGAHRSGVLDDFRTLHLFGGNGEGKASARSPDKGHVAQFYHLRSVAEGSAKHTYPSPLATMRVTLAARLALSCGAILEPSLIGEYEASNLDGDTAPPSVA